jgi:tetratricopeptide (TPR) repeat protein
MFKRFFNLSELEKEQHPNVYWDACGKLGDIYRREGKFSDAERYYKLGLDWWRSHGNPETGWAPKALYGYGLTLYEAGKFKEAEEPLKEDRTLVRHSAQIDLGLKAAVRKLYIDALYHSNWFNALSTQLNDSDKD